MAESPPDTETHAAPARREPATLHENPVLCLAGMHRSGTSLVMSWLEAAGLRIDNGDRLGADHGNERGHYEDKQFVGFHSGLISTRWPRSWGWKAAPTRPLAFNDEQRERARRIVRQRDSEPGAWGWKDPRTCLFLDAWKQVLPRMRVLGVWRPCEEVVRSLRGRARHRRDRVSAVSIPLGVRLWVSHNRLLLRHAARHPETTALVELGTILADETPVVRCLTKDLGIQLQPPPFKSLYESGLIGPSVHSAAVRAAMRFYGVETLTRALRAQSLRAKRSVTP